VRAVALSLIGLSASLLVAGCGSPVVTDTAATSPVRAAAAAAALPLTAPEHDFLEELESARGGVDTGDARGVVAWGHTACTALIEDAGDPQRAVDAVRATSSLPDGAARELVKAAADHLCPVSSTVSTMGAAASATTARPRGDAPQERRNHPAGQ
jgi:Protein of unknown function (DUF732)